MQASASTFEKLGRFRLTSSSRPCPWQAIRQVDIPAFRLSSPDLQLVKSVTSAVSDFRIDEGLVKDNSPVEIAQLLNVFQCMLQFSLFSQNVLLDQLTAKQNVEAVSKISSQHISALEGRLEVAKAKLGESQADTIRLQKANFELEKQIIELKTKLSCTERELEFHHRTRELISMNNGGPKRRPNNAEIHDDGKPKRSSRRCARHQNDGGTGNAPQEEVPVDAPRGEAKNKEEEEEATTLGSEDGRASSSQSSHIHRNNNNNDYHRQRPHRRDPTAVCCNYCGSNTNTPNMHGIVPPYVDWPTLTMLLLQQQQRGGEHHGTLPFQPFLAGSTPNPTTAAMHPLESGVGGKPPIVPTPTPFGAPPPPELDQLSIQQAASHPSRNLQPHHGPSQTQQAPASPYPYPYFPSPTASNVTNNPQIAHNNNNNVSEQLKIELHQLSTVLYTEMKRHEEMLERATADTVQLVEESMRRSHVEHQQQILDHVKSVEKEVRRGMKEIKKVVDATNEERGRIASTLEGDAAGRGTTTAVNGGENNKQGAGSGGSGTMQQTPRPTTTTTLLSSSSTTGKPPTPSKGGPTLSISSLGGTTQLTTIGTVQQQKFTPVLLAATAAAAAAGRSDSPMGPESDVPAAASRGSSRQSEHDDQHAPPPSQQQQQPLPRPTTTAGSTSLKQQQQQQQAIISSPMVQQASPILLQPQETTIMDASHLSSASAVGGGGGGGLNTSTGNANPPPLQRKASTQALRDAQSELQKLLDEEAADAAQKAKGKT